MTWNVSWKIYLILLRQVFSLDMTLAVFTFDSVENEADLSQVEVVEGFDASLPCSIQSPPQHDVPALTLWYIGNQETPVFSYDERDPSRSSVDWSDKRVFVGGRAKYHPLEHPPVLVLKNVTTRDKKLYRCRVDYHKSNSRQAWVRLSVIVPPSKIEILPRISPVEIGQRDDVVCRVTGGSPLPKVEWLQEDQVVDVSSLQSEENISYNVLEEVVTRGDLTRPFTCKASNNKFTQPLIATYTRNVSCGPLSVKIVPEEMPLVAGRRARLRCTVIGSNPPALVTWYQHVRQVTPLRTQVQLNENKTISVLLLDVTRQLHGRHLVCRAEHPTLPLTTLEDIYTLDVSYKPNVSLSLGRGLDPSSLREGNDIFFECNIDANPPPYKVTWLHQGEELLHNASAGVLVSESTLVLQQVQRQRSGEYKCFASNVEGDSHSNKIVIRIKYSPRCAMSPSLRGVALFELTNITCAVDADPTNVTFTWTFNNSLRRDQSEVVRDTRYKQEGLRSTLSYTPMSERDYGTLLCFATNEVGRQKEPCSFTIISAGPPEEVSNCTVGNVTSHSAGITCLHGFDGGLPQKFLLQVWDMDTGELALNRSGTSSPVFSAKPLDPGHTYRAEVIAYNSRGNSNPVTLTVLTLKAAEMHKSLPSMVEPSPLVFIMGLAGGVVVVFGVMLLAVVWWLKKSPANRESTVTQVVLKDSNPDLISVEASAEGPSLREIDSMQVTATTYSATGHSPEVSGYQRYGEDTTSLYRSSSPEVTERTRLTSSSTPSSKGGGGGGVGGGGGGGIRSTSKSKNGGGDEGSLSASLLMYEDGINRRISGAKGETDPRRDTVVCLYTGGSSQEASF